MDIFFLLSGYIIVASLRDSESWKTFAIKRFFRIYPLYFVVLAFTLIWEMCVNSKDIEFAQIVLNVFFLPYGSSMYRSCIVGVAWSTFFEMFFYLLVALLLFFRVQVRSVHFAIVGLISVVYLISHLSLYSLPRGINPVFDSVRMITGSYHVFMFVAGVLLQKYIGEILRLYKVFCGCLFQQFSKVLVILVTSLFLGAFILKYNILVAFVIVPFTFMMWVIYEAINGKISNWVVRFFARIGDFSYSLYLWHMLIIRILFAYLDFSFYFVAISLILPFVISYISYKYIEDPFVRFGKKLLRLM